MRNTLARTLGGSVPKKKRVEDAVDRFEWQLAHANWAARDFTASLKGYRSCSVAYDAIVIQLYRAFEEFMLDLLVTAINQDTSVVSATIGRKLPKHLTAEVCEYLVVGNGYWDFKGRDGLIKSLKRFLPADHFVVEAVSNDAYRATIEQLVALRNFAAHSGPKARERAMKAIGAQRVYSAGAWLKGGARFQKWFDDLLMLSDEVIVRATGEPRAYRRFAHFWSS
jgi:mRNA-degrading endonuclease YafQ of YafQ-DinJ toxin-antitoxin module